MHSYTKTDQHIHQLAQTIAKFNRTYASPKPDDGHTNLAFDYVGCRLVGRWVEASSGPVIIAMNLRTFRFSIYNRKWEKLFSIPIDGKTQAELEESIASFISGLGLDPKGFTDPLHFEITKYDFADQAFSAFSDQEVTEWEACRSLAQDASQWILLNLQIDSEIRIWPHHFDTGIYVEPTENVGIGFGLAIEDDLVGAPYFYYSGTGLNGYEIDFQNICDLTFGRWIIQDNWKGAVLEISEANRHRLSTFIHELTIWYLEA